MRCAFVLLVSVSVCSLALAAPPQVGPGIVPLVRLLGQSDDAGLHRDVLVGMLDALRGQRSLVMPMAWPAARSKLFASQDERVRDLARELAVLFGDPEAQRELVAILESPKQPPERRTAALSALLQRRPDTLETRLVRLLDDAALRSAAIRGLAEFENPKTPALLLSRYSKLNDVEKEDVIHTLSSRRTWARELVAAMTSGGVPRKDVSAFTVRQLMAFQDEELSRQLVTAWGVLKPASQERGELIAKYKALLTPEFVAMADLTNGQSVFKKSCAACHVLFSEGGKIGPELTGAQRTNLDYVLENLVDPSAVVSRDYQVRIVATADGRTLHGVIRQETPHALVLQTPNEIVTVPRAEIEEQKQSGVSLMPEGLLAKLSDAEIRDLVAYLGK
jgi:putative heme-binding domain-containing protein